MLQWWEIHWIQKMDIFSPHSRDIKLRQQSFKLYRLEDVKNGMRTRRRAFMALLILEQLDLRVDQQWINMAAFTVPEIPIGMGNRVFERLFLRGRHCSRFFWDHISKSTGGGGNSGSASPFLWQGNLFFFSAFWRHVALLLSIFTYSVQYF